MFTARYGLDINVSEVKLSISIVKTLYFMFVHKLWRRPFCYNASTTLLYSNYSFDVRGSVHHSTILIETPNKMQQCIKIFYSIF